MKDLLDIINVTDCKCLDSMPLAYSYVPMQVFKNIYDNDTSLGKGTAFPELYKPMNVYGKEFKETAEDMECMR
ncbi:MAG: spore coat associated protein CotJA [Clostridia bacterium]|nr:spore coat associated protein CotJA [Clostridia bacterium]